MKTALLALIASLSLVGCANDPATNYQWAQFANGLAAAAGQQQADSDADFYYRQQQLQRADQVQQLQGINDQLRGNTGGW